MRARTAKIAAQGGAQQVQGLAGVVAAAGLVQVVQHIAHKVVVVQLALEAPLPLVMSTHHIQLERTRLEVSPRGCLGQTTLQHALPDEQRRQAR